MVVATACALRRVSLQYFKIVHVTRLNHSLDVRMRQCLFFVTHISSALETSANRSVRSSLYLGFVSGIGLGGIVGTLLGRATSGMACWLSLVAQQDAVECSYLKVIHMSCDGTHAFASDV